MPETGESFVPHKPARPEKAEGGRKGFRYDPDMGMDARLSSSALLDAVFQDGRISIEDAQAARQRMERKYPAERGYVDAVIPPSHTRVQVTKALRVLANKRQTLPPKMQIRTSASPPASRLMNLKNHAAIF